MNSGGLGPILERICSCSELDHILKSEENNSKPESESEQECSDDEEQNEVKVETENSESETASQESKTESLNLVPENLKSEPECSPGLESEYSLVEPQYPELKSESTFVLEEKSVDSTFVIENDNEKSNRIFSDSVNISSIGKFEETLPESVLAKDNSVSEILPPMPHTAESTLVLEEQEELVREKQISSWRPATPPKIKVLDNKENDEFLRSKKASSEAPKSPLRIIN